jgi:pimeloyl-ACP methyl ester carboxylesterase
LFRRSLLPVSAIAGALALVPFTPKTWTERAYPNLIYFNEVDKGGHFAYREESELFANGLRAALRTLR